MSASEFRLTLVASFSNVASFIIIVCMSACIFVCLSVGTSRYGDGAGNTVEGNSSVFSLVRVR